MGTSRGRRRSDAPAVKPGDGHRFEDRTPHREERRRGGDEGIATAEFSIVTLAAVGFAGLLVAILSGGEVKGLLLGLVRNALGG